MSSGLNVSHAALTGQSPIVAFAAHVDEALRQLVLGYNGAWTARYVRDGARVGAERAAKLVRDAGPEDEPRDDHGRWTTSGSQLPSTVYRGSTKENEEQSTMSEGTGVYVTTHAGTAQQWGQVKSYDVVKQPNLLDLANYNSRARDFVAKVLGISPRKLTQEQFDESAPDIFIQNSGVQHLDQMGFHGYRLGHDVFLRGKLSDYTKKITHDATPPDRSPILQQLVISELRGICEATAQQMVRAYGNGLLGQSSPASTAQSVGAVIDKVGKARSRALVQFSIVRAHAMATLDGFRASGVSHVGTVAERTRSTARNVDLVRDADPVFPSRKVVRAENKLRRVFGKSRVDVLTAGDDRVCPICEDISEEGPYTLDQAEGLIPAHPSCRCSFIPADDARFASVHDAPRLIDSTTHIAAGVMILDPKGRALFLKRSANGDHAGEWAFPGGAVEPGETAEGAAAREVFEEIRFAPVNLEQIDRRETDGVDFTTFGTMVTGEFTPTLDIEHTDWCWCKLTDAPEPLHPGVRATVDRAVLHDDFNPDEPRDPQGKWTTGGGSLDISDLTKVSGKKGSNEGGVYTPNSGDLENLSKQYYIKQPASKDHVTNELVAAKLYQLAGVHTLNYVPVKGDEHVATELESLDKNNIKDFDLPERDAAKSDFAVHAWLANWDAVGTGGDNVGLRKNGEVVTLDTGGSLKYRAQGEPKGAAFGNEVTEINTLRDPNKSPDAAKLYGDMTNEQIVASINRVKAIPDGDIIKTVIKNGGTMSLANQLIARKDDLASQAATMSTESPSLITGAGFKTFGTAPLPAPEPTVFKTKMEHAKFLLMKGTTSEELKKSLNWPAIGVPATAASLNLKLEKTKVGGAFFYKGTPMTPEEIKAAKGAKAASTVTPIAPPVSTISAPVKTNGSTPQDFHNALQAAGVPTGDVEKLISGNWKISAPTPQAEKMAAVAKNHPEWKLIEGMVATYTAPATAFGDNNVSSVTKANTPSEMFGSPTSSNPDKHLVPATQAELDKAKKNTKLTAQYVPGAPTDNPAAQDLIDKFNIKWHGIEPWSSSIPEQAKAGEVLLHEKVSDFKKLQADMVPLMNAQQQAQASAKANQLSSAAAKKAAAVKAEADKLANLHNLPEEEQRKYWLDKTTGGSASGYMASGENAIAKSKKLQEAGVTPAEVGFIKAFTGSYSGVNSAMRDGHMSEETFAFKHIMNDALAKMPPHNGSTVYRKISLDSSEQAKYQVGQIAHWKAFNSTSKNEGTWSGNTHFTILNPKTGVDVQSISSHPSEAEVIMPADTYYKVLSKKQSGGNTHITMEEMLPFGKKLKKVA